LAPVAERSARQGDRRRLVEGGTEAMQIIVATVSGVLGRRLAVVHSEVRCPRRRVAGAGIWGVKPGRV
jgi:hypothetical protein